MSHTFVSPKRGGILQSSGFLDLKTLIALSRTCKANGYDERSLILLIDNEITRDHEVRTRGEAIAFWRDVQRNPWLRQWLNRNSSTVDESLKYPQRMLSAAVYYDVMLSKMLRMLPDPFAIVNRPDEFGMTIVHYAA